MDKKGFRTKVINAVTRLCLRLHNGIANYNKVKSGLSGFWKSALQFYPKSDSKS